MRLKRIDLNISLLIIFLLSGVFLVSSMCYASYTSHTDNHSAQHDTGEIKIHGEHHELKIHEDLHNRKTHEEARHEGDKIPFDHISHANSNWSTLPLWLFLIPLFGGIALGFLSDNRMGGHLLVVFTGITFVLSVFLYNPVINGVLSNGNLLKGIYYEIPFLPSFGFNLTFKVDPITMTFVIFSCLIWFLTAFFSSSYMEIERNQKRYNIANCCCLAVTLGAFMAGDFFTLYIFYEAILLFLFLMVIHREDDDALTASKIYIYLGVATGLILLYGIFLLYHVTGTVEIKSLGLALASVPRWTSYIIAGMLIVGFGGKAGIFLEHIWMPHSYGSAPCLTAALSSGIMIEVGAYGILRTANMIFAPLGMPMAHQLWKWPSSLLWIDTTHIGHVLIWAGILTMFFGALNALISNHSLKLLAYSSVSQMGYIIMGIGCAAYMGTEGAMGLTASSYHIINHALFKSALFLCVGAVFFLTRETDIRKLGGLWHNMPLTALVMLVSICAISGIPGFNGFASKTMLHHAIVEAYEHSVHIIGKPDNWLRIAEIIFIITAGCTFAYNIKLFSFIFLGKQSKKYSNLRSVPIPMKISLIILSVLIISMGIFPNWFLNHFLGPMLSYFGFNPGSHAYHAIFNLHAVGGPRSTIPLLYDPVTKAFFSSTDVIHNLVGGSSAIMIGGVIIILGLTFGLFLYKLSKRFSVEYYYKLIFSGFMDFCSFVYRRVVFAGELIIAKLMVYIWMPPLKMEYSITPKLAKAEFDEKEIMDYLSGMEDKTEKSEPERRQALLGHILKLEKRYDKVIDKTINERSIFRHISNAEEKFSKSMDKAMFPGDLFTKISRVDDALSRGVDKALRKKNVFDKVTSVDGQFDGLIDKVIFSRVFWGFIARKDTNILTSNFFRRFTNLEKKYDSLIEKFLFGLIGSEDLSKIKLKQSDFSKSWFLNICKKVARIHTGDISSYISWIAIALTVIIVVLVGIPYLKTPFTIILAITLTIFATTILALLFL